mgnify:CR=1 FL=1
MDQPEYDRFTAWRFYITTNAQNPLGLTFHYRDIYTIVRYQVVLAALVLAFVYVLIVFELMHRTIAAMIGSFVCIGVLCSTSFFLSPRAPSSDLAGLGL